MYGLGSGLGFRELHCRLDSYSIFLTIWTNVAKKTWKRDYGGGSDADSARHDDERGVDVDHHDAAS